MITDDDSNPDPDIDLDPDPDLDPERERDLDVDPDTQRVEPKTSQPSGVRVGLGYTNEMLNGMFDQLEGMCTGEKRDTVRRETYEVIAVCSSNVTAGLLEASLDKLHRNPPALPRALLTVVQRECERRGEPVPILSIPSLSQKVS